MTADTSAPAAAEPDAARAVPGHQPDRDARVLSLWEQLLAASREEISRLYLEHGVRVSPSVLVAPTIRAVAEAARLAGAKSVASAEDVEETVDALGFELAGDGTLERADDGRWVMSATARWEALAASAGDDWVTRGLAQDESPWVVVATAKELKKLAGVGARSDQPRRALAYAVRAVTGSDREAVAALSFLADIDEPGTAAAMLVQASGPLAPTDVVALVRGVLAPAG